MIELVRDLKVINVLTKFENDPWKNCGRESVNGDFPCAKLENAKKIRQIFFLATMKKPGTYIDYHV